MQFHINMLSKLHFIKGLLKNLFNPRISNLAFVSASNTIAPTVSIFRFAKIKGSTIGDYTYIRNDTDVESADIGKVCSIADHCRVGMGGHTLGFLSTSPLFTEVHNGTKSSWINQDIVSTDNKRAIIGNDVWIASHVLINGGVTVGNGAVIGAGAVVVKDVPPYAIVGGVPAKIIRYRFPADVIAKLEELKWWDMPEEKLKEHIALFQKEDVTVEELERLRETGKIEGCQEQWY